MYFGKDAIAIGLADGIATLEQALDSFDSRTTPAAASPAPQFSMPTFTNNNQLTILKSISK